MRYFYDDEHDSLLVTFRDADYGESEEIYDGFVMDFDTAGRPMGFDIYRDASKFIDIERLQRDFAPMPPPEPVRRGTMILRDAPMEEPPPSKKRPKKKS